MATADIEQLKVRLKYLTREWLFSVTPNGKVWHELTDIRSVLMLLDPDWDDESFNQLMRIVMTEREMRGAHARDY